MQKENNNSTQHATLAGGCFWCIEAIFTDVKGISKVTSGYMGGNAETADYKTVCSGNTDHAEVVKIEFDPNIVSYEDILGIFFSIHNPTTLNRQGNDIGRQYRSAIFYTDNTQKEIAHSAKLNAQKLWEDPIVTEIVPTLEFYAAEEYHQNFFNENPNQSYCAMVVNPKVTKFRQKYSHMLKNN